MKTFKASVDTEIITSEDGMNTYEVIKKLSLFVIFSINKVSTISIYYKYNNIYGY